LNDVAAIQNNVPSNFKAQSSVAPIEGCPSNARNAQISVLYEVNQPGEETRHVMIPWVADGNSIYFLRGQTVRLGNIAADKPLGCGWGFNHLPEWIKLDMVGRLTPSKDGI
jgi:hypothetical protein